MIKDSLFTLGGREAGNGEGSLQSQSLPSLLSIIFLSQVPQTKRESVTVIKQSVINEVPLRNNEARHAAGTIDGGLVKRLWFPQLLNPEEVEVDTLLIQHCEH